MMGESYFTFFCQLTVVYLLYSLLKRCDVKQSEEKNDAPTMLFDVYIFVEVLIAAVYFLAFLFLDALSFFV